MSGTDSVLGFSGILRSMAGRFSLQQHELAMLGVSAALWASEFDETEGLSSAASGANVGSEGSRLLDHIIDTMRVLLSFASLPAAPKDALRFSVSESVFAKSLTLRLEDERSVVIVAEPSSSPRLISACAASISRPSIVLSGAGITSAASMPRSSLRILRHGIIFVAISSLDELNWPAYRAWDELLSTSTVLMVPSDVGIALAGPVREILSFRPSLPDTSIASIVSRQDIEFNPVLKT